MGPGTGAITREIARLLRPGDMLDCYEIDDGFASYLQQRVATDELFEAVRDGVRVHVMPAQAASLDSAAQFVICSLPLNNLAPEAVHDIFRTGARLLDGRGWFTYFEYIALPALKRRFTGIDLTPRLVPRLISVTRCCDPTPKSVPVRGLGFGVPKPPVASPWRTP